MRDMPSKFIEILDFNAQPRISDSDVRLEDVLADHEAFTSRPVSSTQSSKVSLDRERVDRASMSPSPTSPTSPTPSQRWKRLKKDIDKSAFGLWLFDERSIPTSAFRSLPTYPHIYPPTTTTTSPLVLATASLRQSTLRKCDTTNHDE
ncbi:hypothetical protein BDV19DRAFT_384533 [Aspergillus venezuelensis]